MTESTESPGRGNAAGMHDRILVGCTIPAYKAADDDPYESLAWLMSAEGMARLSPVDFFATLETDGRGLSVFGRVISRLQEVGGSHWVFSVDTGANQIGTRERLPRICAGRNLVIEHALRGPYSHVLFLDSDLSVPPDSVGRLLALDRPLAGGNVPSYCLDGPVVREPDVREHWNTAGFLLARREVLRFVRWGTDPHIDPKLDLTDDPHFARTAERLGFGKTWVDHTLVGDHKPLVAVEHRGHDLKIY